MAYGCFYFGRKTIYTNKSVIDESNVAEVLRKALSVHAYNRQDMNYLYNYYKGDQPILGRKKEIRPEINNKVVENRANEIVSFKVGYLMGEPIQYISLSDQEDVTKAISRLNRYMAGEAKPARDRELSQWQHIVGTAYRMVLPDATADTEQDEAPFEIYTLDPRNAFVVRHNSLGTPVVMGVKYVDTDDGVLYSCYTKTHYYEVTDKWDVVRAEEQPLGIPIVEYPLNEARLGAFEIVIPLLDAINRVDSNRLDGIEQFIQALLLFHNVDITSEDFDKLKELGGMKFKDIDPQLKGEITYLVAELNQGQTQTLVDHLYNTVLTICGMPNRNGGSSTSDTGTAVVYRDGWSAAETRAKDTETMFKQSEDEFLSLVLRICDDISGLKLHKSAIDIRFTRRNYENISEKVNVLVTMLNNPKIDPQLAYTHCGLFSDPQVAWAMSKAYIEEQEKKAAALPGEDSDGKQIQDGADPGAAQSH